MLTKYVKVDTGPYTHLVIIIPRTAPCRQKSW